MIAEAKHKDSIQTKADYVQGPKELLFITSFWPTEDVFGQRAVLILPPFGEEMNKSRRMLGMQGRALARAGMPAFVPDVRGSGDSYGDLAESSWEDWNSDICRVVDWIVSETIATVSLLALRSGAFLTARMFQLHQGLCDRLVLWNPVIKGSKMMDQLFRQNRFRQTGKGAGLTVQETRAAIRASKGMEIGGYWISEDLLSETDQLDLLEVLSGGPASVQWLDVGSIASDHPPSKSRTVMDQLTQRQINVNYQRILGLPFWLGPEIETVPELLELTTAFLAD